MCLRICPDAHSPYFPLKLPVPVIFRPGSDFLRVNRQQVNSNGGVMDDQYYYFLLDGKEHGPFRSDRESF